MSTVNPNLWRKGIETSAIVKAIQFLRSAKCDFFIMRDGEVVMDTFPKRSDLTAPPPRLRERGTTSLGKMREPIRRTNDFLGTTNYARAVEMMTPGKPLTFLRADYPLLKNKQAWVSFQASLHSKVRKQWGLDNFVVDRDSDKAITVMRVDPDAPFTLFESKSTPARKGPARAIKTPAKKSVKHAVKHAVKKTGNKEGVNIDKVHQSAPAPAAVPKKVRRRQRRSFADTAYGDKIKALKVGEELVFRRADYESLKKSNAAWLSFASAAMSRSRRLFGTDHVIHKFEGAGGELRMLRVS